MDYKATLNFIHSLGNFSLPAGTERIKQVLELLGSPQNSLRAIHIAGTNGKGSISAMLARVFALAGYRTALFISPYIIDFRERIQIDGEFISKEALVEYAERVREAGVALTEFEFITAVAFLYFAEQKCDILICETGLGGRLDATNTLDNLVAAVITKIGLDHTAILGDSIEKIAYEKCGILRDCPTISYPYQPDEALRVLRAESDNLILPDMSQAKVISQGMNNTFIYKGVKYKLSLKGEFQIANAITAIETVLCSGCEISTEILQKALATTFFPARMEYFSDSPPVVLDGAHNPDGATVIAQELRRFSGEAVAVIGMMRDKDCESFLKTTLPHCAKAYCVTVSEMPRALSGGELMKIAEPFCECEVIDDISSAIIAALQHKKPLFIFGSLYLAAAARSILIELFK